MVTGEITLGIKHVGREADHSAPQRVDVKNASSYTSTPQYVFMVWCLVKLNDTFTFTFTWNFPGITPKLHTVMIFVMLTHTKMFHTEFIRTFVSIRNCICLCLATLVHYLSPTNRKLIRRFRTADMLFYIIQNNYLN
jgi:hypothetical protein